MYKFSLLFFFKFKNYFFVSTRVMFLKFWRNYNTQIFKLSLFWEWTSGQMLVLLSNEPLLFVTFALSRRGDSRNSLQANRTSKFHSLIIVIRKFCNFACGFCGWRFFHSKIASLRTGNWPITSRKLSRIEINLKGISKRKKNWMKTLSKLLVASPNFHVLPLFHLSWLKFFKPDKF